MRVNTTKFCSVGSTTPGCGEGGAGARTDGRQSLIRRYSGSARTFGFIVMLALAAASLAGAPQAELWPRWEEHDPSSTETVNHAQWARFLDRYLETSTRSGVNLVRYSDVSTSDRAELQRYIAMLEDVMVSDLNRDEQMAYWLNLYNAVTVELILEHYPVDSIRDINISGSLFNRHPWDAELVEVEGEALTLNDIEHRIIRPIWEDPRIHYVVNCASIGCPNLQPTPFTGDTYDAVFDEAAREYLTHPRGVRFEGDTLYLSSIFDWYSEDWDDSKQVIVDHIIEYAEGSTAARLQTFADEGYDGRVRYEYDWALNEP